MKTYCQVHEKVIDAEGCWYQKGKIEDPTKVCINCDHYKVLNNDEELKTYQNIKVTKEKKKEDIIPEEIVPILRFLKSEENHEEMNKKYLIRSDIRGKIDRIKIICSHERVKTPISQLLKNAVKINGGIFEKAEGCNKSDTVSPYFKGRDSYAYRLDEIIMRLGFKIIKKHKTYNDGIWKNASYHFLFNVVNELANSNLLILVYLDINTFEIKLDFITKLLIGETKILKNGIVENIRKWDDHNSYMKWYLNAGFLIDMLWITDEQTIKNNQWVDLIRNTSKILPTFILYKNENFGRRLFLLIPETVDITSYLKIFGKDISKVHRYFYKKSYVGREKSKDKTVDSIKNILDQYKGKKFSLNKLYYLVSERLAKDYNIKVQPESLRRSYKPIFKEHQGGRA